MVLNHEGKYFSQEPAMASIAQNSTCSDDGPKLPAERERVRIALANVLCKSPSLNSLLSEGVRGWLLQASSATSGPWMAISEEPSMRSPPGMAGIA